MSEIGIDKFTDDELVLLENAYGTSSHGQEIKRLVAEIRRLRALENGLRPLAKVGLEAIVDCSWHGCGFDGGDIQESAVKAGAIQESADGYDPALHGESDICDPGDRWYEFTPAVLAAKLWMEEGK